MRYFIFLLSITILSCNSESSDSTRNNQEALAANEFKDGEYTMKQYYFVMLKKGENRDENIDTAIVNELQRKHLANIDRLADEGKIIVAGPFGDDGDWRGIFIFNCDKQEEVEGLLNTDPMVAAKWLSYEIHPWWTAKNEVFK
ncbi:MAG: YciI family protein [Flavipsychrobacter sp.]